MTREDAVFVVRCVVSARGGNPDIVKSQRQGSGETGGANHVGDSGNKADNRGMGNQNTISGTKAQNTSVCLLEAPCSVKTNKQKRGGEHFKGKLYLYSDRLEFIPSSRKGEQIQYDYQNVHELGSLWKQFFMSLLLGGSISCMLMLVVYAVHDSSFVLIGIMNGLVWIIGALFEYIVRSMKIITNIENKLGDKIYCSFSFWQSQKMRAIDIIRKGMQGQL